MTVRIGLNGAFGKARVPGVVDAALASLEDGDREYPVTLIERPSLYER